MRVNSKLIANSQFAIIDYLIVDCFMLLAAFTIHFIFCLLFNNIIPYSSITDCVGHLPVVCTGTSFQDLEELSRSGKEIRVGKEANPLLHPEKLNELRLWVNVAGLTPSKISELVIPLIHVTIANRR